jgi:hypothetical protein
MSHLSESLAMFQHCKEHGERAGFEERMIQSHLGTTLVRMPENRENIEQNFFFGFFLFGIAAKTCFWITRDFHGRMFTKGGRVGGN